MYRIGLWNRGYPRLIIYYVAKIRVSPKIMATPWNLVPNSELSSFFYHSRLITFASSSHTSTFVYNIQFIYDSWDLYTHTHTHARLTAPCPGVPGWAGTRKVKPVWILLEQETVSGSGISWAICVSTTLQTDNHASTPLLSFLEAGCPSCRPIV